MKLEEGQKYLYKFGWFGTSFGFGFRLRECILTVTRDDAGRMWLKEGELWFCPVPEERLDEIKDKKFIKRLLLKI